ncbi:MAG: lipid-A-disaccharide synthase [Alphaproteobacteria bacterium]
MSRERRTQEIPALGEKGDGPLLFMVAGEPSGDALGARLMAALKRAGGGPVRFAGVGGPLMEAEGLASLFPMGELAVMGLVEILPHAPRLLRRLGQTAAEIRRLEPDAVVTIDSPGFSFRLAQRLRGSRILHVHYVAPQLWAWRPERGKKIAQRIDHLMALLPFEPAFFEVFGLACSFVGHPVIEAGADRGDGPGFRARHGIGPEAVVVSLLPGSRHTEVERTLPVFGRAMARLTRRLASLVVVLPVADTVARRVERAVADWPFPVIVVRDAGEKYDAFAASEAALAKSGTVTLELALAKVPMVIAYRVNPITGLIARRLIRVPHVSLVNLLLERPLVPELLQQACTPERIADALARLIEEPEERRAQIEGFGEIPRKLGSDGVAPSARAAEVLLGLVRRRA